jgi:hypothetical protein
MMLDLRAPRSLPRILFIPIRQLFFRLLWAFFPSRFPRNY